MKLGKKIFGVKVSAVIWLIAGAILVGIVILWRVVDQNTAYMGQVSAVSKLKHLGLYARLYSEDHEDSYPARWSDLIPYCRGDPLYIRTFTILCTCAPDHTPGMLSNVDQWCDYTLVPNRKESDPDGTVLAYCDPAHWKWHKGGVVLFTDRHTEVFGIKDMEALTNRLAQNTRTIPSAR